MRTLIINNAIDGTGLPRGEPLQLFQDMILANDRPGTTTVDLKNQATPYMKIRSTLNYLLCPNVIEGYPTTPWDKAKECRCLPWLWTWADSILVRFYNDPGCPGFAYSCTTKNLEVNACELNGGGMTTFARIF